MINVEDVSKLFLDCLYQDGEDYSNHKVVKGITMNVGFDPDRIDKHKVEIENLFKQLDVYKEGLFHFTQMCMSNGDIWTGLHAEMEKLMLLALATDLIIYAEEDRRCWPFGVPILLNVKEMNTPKEKKEDLDAKN